MSHELSPSARKVQDVLLSLGLEFQVIELPTSTRTAQEAAQSIGCKVEQIIKSVVFRIEPTDQPILVLASGSNRVNENKISNLIGEPIGKASAGFVRDKTGFAIGGVPPVGHKEAIQTYVDRDLLQYEELWAAAGTPNAVFKLNSADLLKMSNGEVISIE
jgi:prolyl-tRNA editing enzyme YbaK/EbsC (Cys-tRNA(Pro) deacylase)